MLLESSTLGNPEWPSGMYGLPRPASGCPKSWKEGMRYHDTEDYHSHNLHSVSYHFAGTVNKHGIRQEFCVKDDPLKENDFDILWPEGKYCIYKYGDHCPIGLKEGWIFWDDENQEDLDGGNAEQGFLPEGVYELDTLMYFCCSTKGNPTIPIELPIQRSFYLMAFNSTECQKVKGIEGVSEFIQWDDEDRGNANAHSQIAPYGVNTDAWNTRIYYCYYEAGECGKSGVVCQNSSEDAAQPIQLSEVVDETFEHDHPAPAGKDNSYLSKHNRMGKAARNSGVAVIIGCSVAGVIVGTAASALILKYILKKKGYAETPEYESDEEEVFPMPDHFY